MNIIFDTKTELSVRMRELNFGMSALSGSVGAGAAAEVAGAIQQAPDALSSHGAQRSARGSGSTEKSRADWVDPIILTLRHLYRGRA